MLATSSPPSVGAEARSIGKLSGGSNGTAATPAIGSSTHSPTTTETASPFATGSMRRSQGALSVFIVCSSSNPAALTTAVSQALNARPGGSRGKQDKLRGKGADRDRVRVRVGVRRRERGQQRLVPQRVDANAVAPRRRRRLHHRRGRQLMACDLPQQLRRHVLLEPKLELGMLPLSSSAIRVACKRVNGV